MIAQAIEGIPVNLSTFVTVITALCSVIVALSKYAYDRFKKCEDWRDAQEPLIRQMAERLGISEGVNDLVNECPVTGCPWKGRLEAFSVEKEHKTKRRNQQL